MQYRQWRVWKNTDSITTTLRTHLKSQHLEEYEQVISKLKLKHANEVGNPAPHAEQLLVEDNGQFDLDTWVKLLIRWVVVDDQVC